MKGSLQVWDLARMLRALASIPSPVLTQLLEGYLLYMVEIAMLQRLFSSRFCSSQF